MTKRESVGHDILGVHAEAGQETMTQQLTQLLTAVLAAGQAGSRDCIM